MIANSDQLGIIIGISTFLGGFLLAGPSESGDGLCTDVNREIH